jgi:hypothetical protein
MAKFKCEVIRCAEEKRNCKATAIFEVDESNVRLWQKHKAAISGSEASRRETGLFVSYDPLRKEAIKKARSLNIPQSCFEASKVWAIRFMHQMGLALRRRMTICQKKCCISNALDGSEDVIV